MVGVLRGCAQKADAVTPTPQAEPAREQRWSELMGRQLETLQDYHDANRDLYAYANDLRVELARVQGELAMDRDPEFNKPVSSLVAERDQARERVRELEQRVQEYADLANREQVHAANLAEQYEQVKQRAQRAEANIQRYRERHRCTHSVRCWSEEAARIVCDQRQPDAATLRSLAEDAEAHPEKLGDVGELLATDAELYRGLPDD